VLPVGATPKLVLCDTSAALSRLTQTTKALLKAGVADRVFAEAAKFPRVTKLAKFGNAANTITAQASVGAAFIATLWNLVGQGPNSDRTGVA
jgi:hypothetical protein